MGLILKWNFCSDVNRTVWEHREWSLCAGWLDFVDFHLVALLLLSTPDLASSFRFRVWPPWSPCMHLSNLFLYRQSDRSWLGVLQLRCGQLIGVCDVARRAQGGLLGHGPQAPAHHRTGTCQPGKFISKTLCLYISLCTYCTSTESAVCSDLNLVGDRFHNFRRSQNAAALALQKM